MSDKAKIREERQKRQEEKDRNALFSGGKDDRLMMWVLIGTRKLLFDAQAAFKTSVVQLKRFLTLCYVQFTSLIRRYHETHY